MLVELGLVEQRLSAVLEVVNDGVSVTEVAERFGVTRQSVHRWLRRYATHGLAGLVDQSTAPGSCPHQMTPQVEARIVEMRMEHPGWGRARSVTGSAATVWIRSRAGRRSTGVWSATG